MRKTKQQYLVPVQSQPLKRAAAYVRMSAEHQKYSTENQMAAIKEYATQHGLSIVQVYSDEGISGLTIKDRAGLKDLINDVLRGKTNFSIVLVYDVSRWGRFQDIDQSAHLEYLCRMSGVDIVYCTEQFQDDVSPMAAVYKALRRVEAANYSRDLSARVFRAHCNLASRGWVQGGTPPYGLKHILVRDDGRPIKGPLHRTKTMRGYHVERARGPQKEVRIVQEIFRRYVGLGEKDLDIAEYLNSKGYKTRASNPWTYLGVRSILIDEQYIGTFLYNRNSCTMLKGRRSKANPSTEWVRRENAFSAIIDPITFWLAQERRRRTFVRNHPTDVDLLDKLRRFVSRHGCPTQKVMMKFGGVAHQNTYTRHFGSIFKALELIGSEWRPNSARWRSVIRRRQLRRPVLGELGRVLKGAGIEIRINATYARFWVEDLPCYFQIAERTINRSGRPRWNARIRLIPSVAFYLLGRVDKVFGPQSC